MRAFAPFWDTIPAAIKRQMLQVPFQDVKQSVKDAKAEAAAVATKLADDEHRERHDILIAKKTHLTAALHDTICDISSLENKIRE